MRGVAQGSLYAILGLGAVLKDTLGGFFIEQNTGGKGGWRWNFFLSAIFQVLGISESLSFEWVGLLDLP
jgi:MFS family permease